MWIWIISGIIGITLCLIYFFVKRIIEKKFAPKSPTINTPLSEFKESRATDTRLTKNKIEIEENISARFERMCLLDPIAYKNDPALPAVIEQYGKLLRGEIADPQGRHMPSETLLGKPNPDYKTYVMVQKKVLGKQGGLCGEARRLITIDKEDALRVEFITKLDEMNFPVEVVSAVLSDEKLNSFTAKNWVTLTATTRKYLQEYTAGEVADFFQQFDDIKILCDPTKIEAYTIFRKYSAPLNIVVEIIRDRITVDQGVRIMKLVIDSSYEWDEAVQEILEEDFEKSEVEELTAKYRSMLKS